MTPGEFLQKFDVLAEIPNAVEKLRELILQLAVQGGLSERLAGDEPALQLLDRGRAAMGDLRRWEAITQAAEQWRDRCGETLPGLPTGWAWACNAQLGDTSPRNDSPDTAVVSFAPMAAMPTDYRVRGVFETRPWGEIKKGYTHFADGDIAVAKITPCFQNGKACVMQGLAGGIGAGTTELHVLRPVPNLVEPLYMLMVYTSPAFVHGGVATFTGTAGQQRVSNDYFRYSPIPLPPRAEQKRIVAKVDELMALCDRLEAQQQERDHAHAALTHAALARFAEVPTAENLEYLFHESYSTSPEELRKAILTLAVRGELCEQSAIDGPVDALLATNDDRRKRIAGNDARADAERQELLSADDRWNIPVTWKWRGLADLVLFVDYRGRTPKKVESGVRLLTAKNVRRGEVTLHPEEFITEAEYNEWMTRGFPKSGDVLFTTEAPMGFAAVVRFVERFALAQRVICFQSYGAIDGDFLVLQILSDQFQRMLDKNGTGVTAKGIKASKLKQLPIAVPPLAEQRRIVAKVNDLMALVDRLAADLAAARGTGEALMDAVVHELIA